MHSRHIQALLLLVCVGFYFITNETNQSLAQAPSAKPAESTKPEVIRDVLYKDAKSDTEYKVIPWPGATVTMQNLLGQYRLRLADRDEDLVAEVSGPFLFHPKYHAYDKDGRVRDVDQAIKDILTEELSDKLAYLEQVGAKTHKPIIGGGLGRRFGYTTVDLAATNKVEEGKPVSIFHGVVVSKYGGTAMVFDGLVTDTKDVPASWRNFRQLVESACDDDF